MTAARRDPRRTLADVPTPFLALDRTRLERNAAAMAERARALGVDLRPHLKTAKSDAVAEIAVRGAGGGITVSTPAECAYFLERGFADQTLAVPIVPAKLEPLAVLVERGARLRVLVDDAATAAAVAGFAERRGVALPVLLEIDCGLGRGGFDPEGSELIEAARAAATSFEGILTHAGQSYDARDARAIRAVAATERDCAVRAAQRVRADAGLACPVISVGSTPTAIAVDHLEGVTEMRPGNYVFFDVFQARLGSCELSDVAMSVVTTVLAHVGAAGADGGAEEERRARLIVDAGGVALSKDRSAGDRWPGIGYGIVRELDGSEPPIPLHVASVHQEHGMIEAVADAVAGPDAEATLPVERYPVGSRLRILPNHACMTAAAHDRYEVVEAGDPTIVATWDRVNGFARPF